MPPESSVPRTYFPVIDILRGLAALAVLILHVIYHASWTTFPTHGLFSIFRSGDQGVDLFFVISGFVVLYNANEIMSENGGRFRTQFALRRLARIVPLYYLTLAFYLYVIDDNQLLISPALSTHLTAHIFFVHTFFWDTFSSINGVNWTIAIEMQFYLLIFIFAPWISKSNFLLILLACITVSILWRYGVFTTAIDSDPQKNYHLFVKSVQLPGRIDQFALGMAIALLIRNTDILRSSQRNLLIAALCFASALLFYFGDSSFLNPIDESLRFAMRGTILGSGFASLVLAACLIDPRKVKFALAPFRYLGKISYGIYLWHLPIIMALKGHGISPPMFLFLTFLATFGIATISYHLFELPLNNIARQFRMPRFSVGRFKRYTEQISAK